MADLAKLVVSLEAQTAKYQRGLDQANKRLARFERRQKRSLKNITGSFQGLAALITGGFFANWIRQQARAIDEVDKLSTRLGTSTEALSEYRLVADRAGIAFNTLTIGQQRLQRRVAEAAKGTGEARGALRELQIDAEKLSKLPLDQQFEVVADQLSKVETNADRTRLAFKLFDSEGVALLQTMENGAAGIREVREEARELGLSLDRDAVDKVVEANDAMTNFKSALDGLATVVTISIVPALQAGAEALTGFITKVDDFARATGEILGGATGIGAQADLLEKEFAAVENQLRILEETARQFGQTAAEFNPEGYRKLRDELERIKDLQLEALQPDTSIGRVGTTGTPAAPESVIDATLNTEGILSKAESVAKLEKNVSQLQRQTADNIAFANQLIDEASEQLIGDQVNSIVAEGNARFKELAAEIDLTSNALDDLIEAEEQAAEAAQELGFTFSSALEDAIVQGENLRSVLQGLVQDLLRILVRRQITEPLANIFGGLFGGTSGGGLLGSLFGRANGGFVAGGQPYMVGERGPELFVPNVAGNIVPNGGGGVTIMQTNNIEAGVDASRLLPVLEENNRKLKGEIVDELDRGQYQ